METLDEPHSEDCEPHDAAILNIISRAPRLSRVYGADFLNDYHDLFSTICYSSLTWEQFCLLADTAGSSLISFENVSIHRPDNLCTSPRLLSSFTTIQSLSWDCAINFQLDDAVIDKDCFPLLEHLRISSCNSSFLTLLAQFR